MGSTWIWQLTCRLFLLAIMWVDMALQMACTIATAVGLDSPFNLGRYVV